MVDNRRKELAAEIREAQQEYEAGKCCPVTPGELVKGILLEDEKDIRDGIKALEDKANTMDWETFKRRHLDV